MTASRDENFSASRPIVNLVPLWKLNETERNIEITVLLYLEEE